MNRGCTCLFDPATLVIRVNFGASGGATPFRLLAFIGRERRRPLVRSSARGGMKVKRRRLAEVVDAQTGRSNGSSERDPFASGTIRKPCCRCPEELNVRASVFRRLVDADASRFSAVDAAVFPDRSIAHTHFVLRNDSCDSLRVCHGQAETCWRAIIEHIDCIAVDFECLRERLYGQGQSIGRVNIFSFGAR